MAHIIVRKRGVSISKEYLIKWKGLPQKEARWEREELLWQFEKQIKECNSDYMTMTSGI